MGQSGKSKNIFIYYFEQGKTFYLLDYVTRRSENLGFKKKKKDFACYCRENACFRYHQRLLKRSLNFKTLLACAKITI